MSLGQSQDKGPCGKNTQTSSCSDSNQSYRKARAGRHSCINEPGSPKRPGGTSTTNDRERKTRGGLKEKRNKKERKQPLWIFSLQIKKKSNQSCLRRLIPGLLFWAGEEWNGTRLEYAKLCALSQELLGGETRSGETNWHSGGKHKSLVNVYCHKH